MLAVVIVSGAATAIAAPSSKKATLKVTTSQKKILKQDGIPVSVKGLEDGKVKLTAKSSTFDDQQLKKLTRSATVRADGKTLNALLPLTRKGGDAIASCEGRDILVSG